MSDQPAHSELTFEERLRAAARRDIAAEARDRAARSRDVRADDRDRAIAAVATGTAEAPGAQSRPSADIVLRAAEPRRHAGIRAAEQPAMAAEDRRAAAEDRRHAASDRLHALADRAALVSALAFAETDTLTGARTRGAGLRDLDRELERCRRSGRVLVVAYIDVIGLKALNDSAGHDAGDALLQRVIGVIRSHLRPYDLIVRLGGDEFLCAMPEMGRADAHARFGEIAALLAAPRQQPTIRVGFAELAPNDTREKLIGRADNEMLGKRD